MHTSSSCFVSNLVQLDALNEGFAAYFAHFSKLKMMDEVFCKSNKIQTGYVTTPCSCGWVEQWPQEMKPQPKVHTTQ